MKISKIILCLIAGFTASSALFAQSEMTAVKLAGAEESNGSARYQALSGAMGAVGVDFSSVAQNPAGIALLRRSSRIDLTLGYSFNKSTSEWYKNISKGDKSSLNFDQLSASFRIGSGTSSWTFGVGLRNTGRSHRIVDALASGLDPYVGSSLADYAGARLNRGDRASHANEVFKGNGDWFSRRSNLPWIGVLGYGAGWVSFSPKQGTNPDQYYSNYIYKNNQGVEKIESPQEAGLVLDEDYYIREADFAFGVNLGRRVNLGFLIATSSFDYTLRSSYSETFRPSTDVKGLDGLSLDNYQSIQGSGAKFGLGLIVEPINGLRLGASIYTPTFYSFDFDYNAFASGHNPYTPKGKDLNSKTPKYPASTFRLTTPWRFGLNGAYIIKHYGLISVDYEFSTFGGTRLSDDVDEWDTDNSFQGDNDALSDDFKGVHRLRIGTEFNVNRRLALRAGARFESSPMDNPKLDQDEPKIEALVAGSMVHYALPKGKFGLSAGLGYRITPAWSVDLAYVYKQEKSSIYAFPAVLDEANGEWLQGLKPIKQTDKQHRLLLTLGFRF